jgi:hypothetical protein
MLFAETTPDGRIYLVRTGPVTHFEDVSSGVHDRERLPLQEHVADDEVIVTRERPGADQESTTPFRRHRAQTHKNMPAVREPPVSLPAAYDLPPPSRIALPPIQRASVPPPARRRHTPFPHPPVSEAASRRSALPPPPRRQEREPDPAQTHRDVMWSLPEEDLVSDVGSSPLHRARREPTPAQRPSKRRR